MNWFQNVAKTFGLATQQDIASLYELQILSSAHYFDLWDGRENRQFSNEVLVDLFFELLSTVSPALFIEAGAKFAEASLHARAKLPKARIVAFEANPHNYKAAVSRQPFQDRGIEYVHCALSDRNGELDFNLRVSQNGTPVAVTSGANSILRRVAENVDYEVVRVPSKRLDDFFNGPPRVALWIDVEGATKQVLTGASSVLKRTDLAIIEVEDFENWEGQWIAPKVIGKMLNAGLIPVARDFEYNGQYNIIFIRENVFQKNRHIRQKLTRYHSEKIKTLKIKNKYSSNIPKKEVITQQLNRTQHNNYHRHIIVGIRYSLVEKFNDTAGRLAFKNIGVKTAEEYVAALLDETRLNGRLDLFKKFPLPSLVNMEKAARKNGIGFTAIVATTDLMPESHHGDLLRACAASPSIKVVTPNDGIRGAIRTAVAQAPQDTIYATIRLDDDDALSPDYVEMLAPYLTEPYVETAVSFPSGYYVYVDSDGSVQLAASVKKPKIALGLAFIQKTGTASPQSIYELGNHQAIDDRYPVILDARKPSFIRVAHRNSDTYSKPGQFEDEIGKMKKNAIDWDEVRSQFHLEL